MESSVLPISIKLLQGVDDIHNDNVDAEIALSNGEVRTVTFFTLANIASILDGYRSSGECLGGKFFWAKDLVIVEDLSQETIREAVWELLRSGEYSHAFGQKV
jgi:hypothetical protein